MDLLLVDEKRGPIAMNPVVPPSLKQQILPLTLPLGIHEPHCQALFQQIPGEGFQIWYSVYHTGAEPVVLKASGGIPVLELRIAIKNSILGTWDKISQPELPPFHFSLGFTPFVATRALFQPHTEYITIDFHFELSFLENFGIGFQALDQFLQKVLKDQPAELAPYPHTCPPEMKDAIRAILYNKYSPAGQPLLQQWKVGEILLAALEVVGRSDGLLPLPLRPQDIRKLHLARNYIADQFPQWPGSVAICRYTQLNQLKLKVGFKHLFQTTPYAFFLELKLREARRLLLEGHESISSIAYLTGYQHPSSFSRSFKEMFGYTPKEFGKEGRY